MSAWLIDTVLYTGALIALVLVLRRPVGRLFGAQLAYGLWALPFLRLLLPVERRLPRPDGDGSESVEGPFGVHPATTVEELETADAAGAGGA